MIGMSERGRVKRMIAMSAKAGQDHKTSLGTPGKSDYDSASLAAAITKSASKQTYYTIRFFVDRDLVPDAYRAYGYFRWLDDILDAQTGARGASSEAEAAEKMAEKSADKIAFIHRQKALLDAAYRGEPLEGLSIEEQMLVDLVRNVSGVTPGLGSYLQNMMALLEFDAGRRGRLISQAELAEYTRLLATAVTDALYFFIGHDDPPPHHEARYLAATAAHITHMLRDMLEDIDAGYFNIPCEVLQENNISQWDVGSQAYREWVCGRVDLAHSDFKAGRECLRQVKNLRRRLAGYAYAARFEWMLHVIERERYCLRSEYHERKSAWAALWMLWTILAGLFASIWVIPAPQSQAVRHTRIKEL
jgi:phytoene/squalene synthetase